MSEYQYYEFVALDRPFSEEARKLFSSLSSRAEVTSRRACFVYNYGDFRGDPWKLVETHCDFHVYVACWGVRLLMKLPAGTLDLETLALFEGDYGGIEGRRVGDGFIVGFATGEDQREEDWWEGEGVADRLAPMREEMRQGDHRFLYLGWLYGIQGTVAIYEGTEGEEEEEILDSSEPPVPAGLGQLTAAQEAFVELVGIDPFLIEAAAEASVERTPTSDDDLVRFLKELPDEERLSLLADMVRGDASVTVRLRRRLADLEHNSGGGGAPVSGVRRTIRELVERAAVLEREEARSAQARREEEERRTFARLEEERQRAAALRQRRIQGLAPEAEQLWTKAHDLMGQTLPSGYDQAVSTLVDLRDFAVYIGKEEEFSARLKKLIVVFWSKKALVNRLKKAALIPEGWRPGAELTLPPATGPRG